MDGGSRKGLFDILARLLSSVGAGGLGDAARRKGLLEEKLRPVGPGDGARWPVATTEQRQHRVQRRPDGGRDRVETRMKHLKVHITGRLPVTAGASDMAVESVAIARGGAGRLTRVVGDE